jgi:hypothetical protein
VLETVGIGGAASDQQSTPESGLVSSFPSNTFSWVGPMVCQRRLLPGGEMQLNFVACFDRVGLYNVSSFHVKAAPMWMITEEKQTCEQPQKDAFNSASCMTVQKCNPVRTIIISQTP